MSKGRRIKYNNLNQDKFIKRLGLKEVTDPILFSVNNIPTENGLLSDSIFGVTPKDRSSTFAYIRLGDKFLHPTVYEELLRYDKKFAYITSGTKKYKLVNGELQEDENGDTGIEWLVENFGKINFNKDNSIEKQILSASLKKYQNEGYFMDKLIVTPPFYRDVDTSKGFLSVGEVNKLYTEILRKSLLVKRKDIYSQEARNDTMYKMQNLILDIMNYYMDEKYKNGSSDTVLGKEGSIYRTILRKTIKYSSRLVLSQSNNEAEHWSQIPVDLDTSLIPLASCLAQLQPFVLFHLKTMIHNRYKSGDVIECLDKNNKKHKVTLKEVDYFYDDEALKKYISRFLKSNGNRFESVKAPNEENKDVYFIFNYINEKDEHIERRLTWTDLIYIATIEAAVEKYVISTRYPLDTPFNQIVHKLKVGSTNETMKVKIRGIVYDNYPKILLDDPDTNTEDKFRETCNISNASIGSMGGDYDGDTVSNKTPFTNEANEECKNFINSKKRSIGMSAKFIYGIDNETILVGYTLTKCDDESKLTEPVF